MLIFSNSQAACYTEKSGIKCSFPKYIEAAFPNLGLPKKLNDKVDNRTV